MMLCVDEHGKAVLVECHTISPSTIRRMRDLLCVMLDEHGWSQQQVAELFAQCPKDQPRVSRVLRDIPPQARACYAQIGLVRVDARATAET
jgi:hypothetical protein